jgi:hypothetical protein
MGALITVLALTAALFLIQDVLGRVGPWAIAGLYLAAPVALSAYWFRVNDFGPFPWIKVYTVLFCACYGTVLRFTALVNRASARFIITGLLALNILEATALDLIGGSLAHALNALAGLVLVATQPRSSHAVRIETARRELHYDLSRLWVLGYTVWNWTFVYLNYPELSGHHTAVLLSALIVGLADPRRWLQARAYTLGSIFIAQCTFFPFLLGQLETSNWSDTRLELIAAGAALVVALGCAARTRGAKNRPGLSTGAETIWVSGTDYGFGSCGSISGASGSIFFGSAFGSIIGAGSLHG